MAIQQVVLIPVGGPRIEFQAEEAVANQIGLDFLTPPTPPRQIYDIKVGNAQAGFSSAVIAVDWGQDFFAALKFDATEQPAP